MMQDRPVDERLKEMLDRVEAAAKRLRKWKRRNIVRGWHPTKEKCSECSRPLPYNNDRKRSLCNPCSARRQSRLNRQKHLQQKERENQA
jgi:hypothetical protein